MKHFDFSAVDMRDREIIPKDDSDLTDYDMDEVDNHFETDIGEDALQESHINTEHLQQMFNIQFHAQDSL
ncbi:hypothetical protein CLU79DRAFT_837477 [Phycomyces nitens]|nr:hypothetical protein CLU79DRAFT_837477 [Phycomyces nitens]